MQQNLKDLLGFVIFLFIIATAVINYPGPGKYNIVGEITKKKIRSASANTRNGFGIGVRNVFNVPKESQSNVQVIPIDVPGPGSYSLISSFTIYNDYDKIYKIPTKNTSKVFQKSKEVSLHEQTANGYAAKYRVRGNNKKKEENKNAKQKMKRKK